MKRVLLFLVILIANSANYSQNQNQHPFFPHHVGDIWEYIEIDMDIWAIVDILQSIIRFDSTDSLYRNHVWFQVNRLSNRFYKPAAYPGGTFIIDSSNNVYHLEEGGLPYFLIYKLDAQQGDQWVMHTYGPGQYEMARCDSVHMEYIFGEWRQTKDFSYYLAWDTTETTGLMRYYSTLPEGLGMIYNGGTPDCGFIHYLKGAVINGILYGDTTYLKISEPPSLQNISKTINLYQNYPNPFNPNTTIEFDLPKTSEVSLKVFNILGEEVATLVSDRLSIGNYSYEWDASNLASGVYLYRLQAGEYVETRKMILMR